MAGWEALPKNIRGIVAVGSALVAIVATSFAVGAATRETITGHKDLPERVTVLEAHEVAGQRRDSTQDVAILELQEAQDIASQERGKMLEILRRVDRTTCRQAAVSERELRECDAR